MDCIIDFEDLNTYPKWIWTLFSKFHVLRKVYECADRDRGDFAYWIEQCIPEAKCLIHTIKHKLQDWSFVAYHITRIIDLDSIRRNGLKIMTCHDYINRMCYIFRDVLKYTSAEVNYCGHVLQEKLNREHACRVGQLSFFAPPSKYNLIERDNGYLSLYGSIVGGEVAKQAFQCNNKVSSDLSKLGNTFLIKAKFYITNLLEDCENDADGFIYFLIYLAAQYHYSKHLNDDAIIIGQVNQSVPPEDICEIIPIDDIE